MAASVADVPFLFGFAARSYALSTTDVEAFNALNPAPTAGPQINLFRWYSHVRNVGEAARAAYVSIAVFDRQVARLAG